MCLSIKGNGNYWFFEIMIKYSNKVFPQLLQSLHHANCLNIVFLVRSIIYGNTKDNKDIDFKGISSNGDIFNYVSFHLNTSLKKLFFSNMAF